jgi:hypothetical protein
LRAFRLIFISVIRSKRTEMVRTSYDEILAGNPEGKKLLGRCGWEVSIVVGLTLRRIWSSHSCNYEEFYIVEYNAL